MSDAPGVDATTPFVGWSTTRMALNALAKNSPKLQFLRECGSFEWHPLPTQLSTASSTSEAKLNCGYCRDLLQSATATSGESALIAVLMSLGSSGDPVHQRPGGATAPRTSRAGLVGPGDTSPSMPGILPTDGRATWPLPSSTEWNLRQPEHFGNHRLRWRGRQTNVEMLARHSLDI